MLTSILAMVIAVVGIAVIIAGAWGAPSIVEAPKVVAQPADTGQAIAGMGA